MAQDKQQPQEAQAITIDTSGYNPALDPSSPDFDVKAWRKAVDDMGGVTELEKRLTADLTEPADRARAYMNLTMGQFVQLSKEEQYLFWQQPAIAKQFESVRSRIKETAAALDEMGKPVTEVTAAMTDMIRDSARATLDGISAIVNSDSYRAFKKSISDIALFLEEHRDELQAIANAPESARDLAPYLKLELDAAQDDPAFADLQLEELFERGFDVDGNLTDSPFRQIIERAQLLKADYETAAETIADIEQAAGELPRVKYKKITEIKSLTDKLAAVFFSLMAPESTPASIEGQRQMTPLRYESLKSKKEITLFYDYVYNEEVLEKYGINKKFDDYDFFVMTIIDTLYANGNNIVSFTKIFKEMGGEGNPTSKQLAPIYYSLLKGMTTIITINDEEVQRAWKTGTYHEILSPIIPVQIGNERFIASGKIANGYVRINGFSPFMQVAQPLGHLTAWNKDILRLYKGRKTKRYYSVMRFLMMQIGWMRNGERSRKILYSSLYKHTGDATTRARQLARDMMYDLLENVFKPTGYITGYKEDGAAAPGVELIIGKQKLIGAKPK